MKEGVDVMEDEMGRESMEKYQEKEQQNHANCLFFEKKKNCCE
jgi:hypothetical protein